MSLLRPLALLTALAASACDRPLDLTDTRIQLQRESRGLHAIDFRPYRLELHGDGTLTFTCTGADGVERTESGRLAPDDVETLVRAALELDFFALEDSYAVPYNDMVLETLELEHHGRSRRVRNNSYAREWFDVIDPTRFETHARLGELAERIDVAVGTRDRLARLIAREPR